jgi:transcriptional regulator with XRE-family HTH domain
VGENLRFARLAHGLSQRDIAVKLGIESFQVSRWERGKHRPSDASLIQLADLLDRDVGWFYADHGEPTKAAA